MLPGEIVTTLSPAPWAPLLAGGCDGATCVTWCAGAGDELGGCDEGAALAGGAACGRAPGALSAVPESGLGVLDDQLPLAPTLRTGRGGTLGTGLF
jgi:hypothetical protein